MREVLRRERQVLPQLRELQGQLASLGRQELRPFQDCLRGRLESP